MAYGFSEVGYYVRKPSTTSVLVTPNAPVDSGESRHTVSNLVHLADECGQVWACDGLIHGRYQDTDITPPSMTVPLHIARVTCNNIRTRPIASDITSQSTADGGGFALRVRIGGATNGVAGTAYFYAIAGSWADDPISGAAATRAYAIASGDSPRANEMTASTTTSTEAWLSGTSSGGASTVITLTAAQVALCARNIATYSYDAAGTAIVAQRTVYTVAVDIFGWATTNNVGPRLHGMYVAEYV